MRFGIIFALVAFFALAQCQVTSAPRRTRRKRKTPAPTEPPMGKNETVGECDWIQPSHIPSIYI